MHSSFLRRLKIVCIVNEVAGLRLNIKISSLLEFSVSGKDLSISKKKSNRWTKRGEVIFMAESVE